MPTTARGIDATTVDMLEIGINFPSVRSFLLARQIQGQVEDAWEVHAEGRPGHFFHSLAWRGRPGRRNSAVKSVVRRSAVREVTEKEKRRKMSRRVEPGKVIKSLRGRILLGVVVAEPRAGGRRERRATNTLKGPLIPVRSARPPSNAVLRLVLPRDAEALCQKGGPPPGAKSDEDACKGAGETSESGQWRVVWFDTTARRANGGGPL